VNTGLVCQLSNDSADAAVHNAVQSETFVFVCASSSQSTSDHSKASDTLESFLRKSLSKVTFERKLSSVSLP